MQNCIPIRAQQAIEQIVGDFGHDEMASEIRDLWLEYEDGTTVEAEAAKQLDKFEMIVQANEYELVHPEKNLESFFKSTESSFTHPEVSLQTIYHYTFGMYLIKRLIFDRILDCGVGRSSACRKTGAN